MAFVECPHIDGEILSDSCEGNCDICKYNPSHKSTGFTVNYGCSNCDRINYCDLARQPSIK